jgi:hypothetical protein
MGVVAWLDRYFVSAQTQDQAGAAVLAATETYTSGDALVTVRGKYASTTTTANANHDIQMPWAIADGSVWCFELYVSAKGTGIRRKIKISALVYGNGATATIDGTPDNDAQGTGTPVASVVVAGSSVYLRLAPGTASSVIWGYEIRAQQL